MRSPAEFLSVPFSEAILHGEFGDHSGGTGGGSGPRYALTLTPTELHIQRLVPRPQDDRRTVVSLSDVVGCHVMRRKASPARGGGAEEGEGPAYFSLYSYPVKKRRMGGGRCRQRVVRTFRVDSAARVSENRSVAEKWMTAVLCLLRGVNLTGATEITSSLLPRPRRLLLLVNPFSGQGQAMQLCHTHILPMVREANISYNLIQTERPNHARELMRELALQEWDGIVIISGDGLLHEVINGLMARGDWKQAIQTPVGILPCGSGNALAGAINHNAGFEMCLRDPLLMNCCFLLCRGGVCPMDLVSITMSTSITAKHPGENTEREPERLASEEEEAGSASSGRGVHRRLFSFLSVAWGFVSDVDIESERYRGLGSARFTMGTLVRLASLRSYRGRLSYLPQSATSLSSLSLPPLAQLQQQPPRRPLSRSITEGLGACSRLPLHRTVSDMGLSEERNLLKRNTPSALSPVPGCLQEVVQPACAPPSDGTPTEQAASSCFAEGVPSISEAASPDAGHPYKTAPTQEMPASLAPPIPSPSPSPSSSHHYLTSAFTFDLPVSDDQNSTPVLNHQSESGSRARAGERAAQSNGTVDHAEQQSTFLARTMDALGSVTQERGVKSDPGQRNHFPPRAEDETGPVDGLLQPLDRPVPKNWVTLEGDFVLVLALYQSHLGADLFAAPQARFDDGTIHLSFVRAGISRGVLLRLFLAMERGTHQEIESPFVSHIQTRAFRLEPLSHRGTLTVDGELVPYGSLQAQVHPGMGRLIVGDPAVKITKF
ncbi:sphingosine kinase 2 [Acipenser ruthenus]|uniref:sphingosine kinase 2 n=1 Tax=Acipenser ruthenus TaxID=7906 RepID=UPI0027420100|nr:sphingosine kinase 2 [Acipenser ruthenus]